MRGEIKRGSIDLSPGNEHLRFSRRMYLARQHSVGSDSPVFGTPVFLEEFDSVSAPRVIRRYAKASPDNPIDFSPEEQFVHPELLGGAQRCSSLVANLENGGARHRLLVILDLVLYVHLVFVLERSRTGLRHSIGQEKPACNRRLR